MALKLNPHLLFILSVSQLASRTDTISHCPLSVMAGAVFYQSFYNEDCETSQWNVTFNLICLFAAAQRRECEWSSGGLSDLLPRTPVRHRSTGVKEGRQQLLASHRTDR